MNTLDPELFLETCVPDTPTPEPEPEPEPEQILFA
jgi:hypothetical protein